MSEKWFCFCILLASSWGWWSADGSCLYPGHKSNERVMAWPPDINDTFSTGTIVTYFCENHEIKDWIKKMECLENGTWIWVNRTAHQQCALETINRCQHLRLGEIPKPLETVILDGTCISLHHGISRGEKVNLESICNTSPFQSLDSKQARGYYYSNDERKSICNAFKDKIRQGNNIPIMLFLTKLDDSDERWLEDFQGGCPYLKCYLWSDPIMFNHPACNFKQHHWMCRHEISSCGIPSQLKNTKMNYSGILIGAVANYQCYHGYTTKNKLIRRCSPNGLWEDRAPKCELVDCGPPKHIENVTVELTNDSTTFESWLNYTCQSPGYYINGSQYRMCQANGRWDGEEPSCIKMDDDEHCSSQFGLNEGEGDLLMLIVGAIASVTIFLIVLMWLVLAALLYRDKRKQQVQSGGPLPETH